jgi:hypothetical protein
MIKINTPILGPGSPPTIDLTGTIICDGHFEIEVSVNGGMPTTVAISNYQITGGQWSATIGNNFPCGAKVEIIATCNTKRIDSTEITMPPCDDCPVAAIFINKIDDCDANGNRPVTFEATVTAPSNMPAVGEWLFYTYPNSPTNAAPNNVSVPGGGIYVPQGTSTTLTVPPLSPPMLPFSFPPTTPGNLHTACIHWSNPPLIDCPDVILQFEVPACISPCCPDLNVSVETRQNCVNQTKPPPGFHFTVSTSANSNCPLPQTTNLVWTLNGPTGKFQLTTLAHAVTTGNVNWRKISVVPNTIGAIDLSIVGMYSITVNAPDYKMPCFPTATVNFEIKDCCPTGSYWDVAQKKCVDCPTIATPQINVSGTSPGGNAAVVFSTSVSPAIATSFNWEVTTPNGTVFRKTTSSPNTTNGTADGTWMSNTTTGNLDINSPGAYVVEVTATGPNISSSCTVSANIGFNIPSTPGGNTPPIVTSSGGGMSIGCWALLVLAITFSVLAVVLLIIAYCTINYYLAIASGIAATLALVFLILWLALCARGNCAIFNWVRWIVMYIMALTPFVAAFIAIFGDPSCGIAAAFISWGHWGYTLLILDFAGPKIGCTLEPLPWP